MISSVITHAAHYLPTNEINNTHLAKLYPDAFNAQNIKTPEEQIFGKTGIQTRRYTSKDETSTSMASEVVKNLLTQSGYDINDINGIIVGSFTPGYYAPSISSELLHLFKSTNGAGGFDISDACPSFLAALETAHDKIQLGKGEKYIVIGVDTMSKVLSTLSDNDYKTGIIFGDGAGGVIVENSQIPGNGIQGTFEKRYDSFGQYSGDDLMQAARIHTNLSPEFDGKPKFDFNGQLIYRVCNNLVPTHIQEYLGKNNLSLDDFDALVLHQANQNMTDSIQKTLGLSESSKTKVLTNIKDVGNTTSAAIPILLSQKIESGELKKLKKGMRVLMCSFGAGIKIRLVDTFL